MWTFAALRAVKNNLSAWAPHVLAGSNVWMHTWMGTSSDVNASLKFCKPITVYHIDYTHLVGLLVQLMAAQFDPTLVSQVGVQSFNTYWSNWTNSARRRRSADAAAAETPTGAPLANELAFEELLDAQLAREHVRKIRNRVSRVRRATNTNSANIQVILSQVENT